MDRVSSAAGPSGSSAPVSENGEGLHSEVRATLAHLIGQWLPLSEQRRVCHALEVERMEPTDFLKDLLKFKEDLCSRCGNFAEEELLHLEEFISRLARIATQPSTGVERECAMFKELITLDKPTFDLLLKECGREHKILEQVHLYREFVRLSAGSESPVEEEIERLAAKGKFQFAQMLSDLIEDPVWKKRFTYKFVMALVKEQNEIKTGAAIAQKAPSVYTQILLIQQIFNIVMKQGDVEGAFTLVREYLQSGQGVPRDAQDRGVYEAAIRDIVRNFADQGDLDRAEEIASLAANQRTKDSCYEVLCNVYIERIKEISATGDIDAAFASIRLSRQIEKEGVKREIRDKIIAVTAVTVPDEDLKRAVVGNFITDPEDLDRALEILRLANEGKLMEIQEMEGEFSSEDHRNTALRAASRIFLQREEIQKEDVQGACYFIDAFGRAEERKGWLTEVTRQLGSKYWKFEDLIPKR